MTARPASIGSLSIDYHFPDFSKLVGSRAFSPVVELSGKRWRLCLFSHVGFQNSVGDVGCFLQCLSEGTTTVSFHASLRNQKHQSSFCDRSASHTFKRTQSLPDHSSSTDGVNGFHDFISRATLLARAADLLMDDTLIIRLEFTILDPISATLRKPISVHLPNYDLLSLQRDEETCDLDIHVVGFSDRDGPDNKNDVLPAGVEVVKAHKLVLSAFSIVFKAMFYGSMQEAQSNKLVIEDFSVQAVQRMVDFLYSGKMDHQAFALSDLLELLTLSCKYQVETWTAQCVACLMDMLSEENAIEILIVVHALSLAEAREIVMDFIAEHPKSTTHGADQLKTCDRDLLLEIILKTAATEENREHKKRKLEAI